MIREELDILIGDHLEELKNRLHWVIGNYFDEEINLDSSIRLKHDLKNEFKKFNIDIDIDCRADNGIMYISSYPSIKDLLGL